jgi:hypothetical protein
VLQEHGGAAPTSCGERAMANLAVIEQGVSARPCRAACFNRFKTATYQTAENPG